MIGIIDYGMGNLGSVTNSLVHLGYQSRVVASPAELGQFSHLIMPGVGSYAKAMENLARVDLVGAIRTQVVAGTPFLGICLGMQLLSSSGAEYGPTHGLDLIAGTVVALEVGPELRIPHVGWNNVDLLRKHPVFDGIKTHVDFYFVHSYHFRPWDAADVIGLTPYGEPFVSCVGRDNVVGVQFHPEKSQDSGLKIIENFCRWDGRC